MQKWFAACAFLVFCAAGGIAEEEKPGTQTLRLVQDDAQDYMVSKIYVLKYVQSNDIMPFVTGIVKRYNMNSVVNCIEYGNSNEQILTVTCPVGMMPYVDDFIAKVDRDVRIDGKVPGEIIRGTGITRAVYRPKYRSGQDLVNVIVNAVIGEGPYGSVYAYDQNSNQIYWKDNSSNTQYMYQFLEWLDRPAPQITFHFTLYEVRESTMRDIGIDYLAWKNGPGLNLFQTGFDVFSLSSGGSAALQSMSGPFGGFLFAPQFDASFLRLLAQSGSADIRDSATLTVSNSDSSTSEIQFSPQFQNIVKSDNDKTGVTISGIPTGTSQVSLKIIAPQVNLHFGGVPESGYPASEAFSLNAYRPGDYAGKEGTVFFGYDIQSASAVERNNLGSELIETTRTQGNALLALNREKLLAQWEKEQEVEQTIGIPFLSGIPVLKYLFSTTTTSREKTRVYLTVTAGTAHPPLPEGFRPGTLKKLKEETAR